MTQPMFGTMMNEIADRISSNLKVNLHDDEEIAVSYGERDYFYTSDRVGYVDLWKSDQSNDDRVRIKVRDILFQLHLAKFIENEMTSQIETWIKDDVRPD